MKQRVFFVLRWFLVGGLGAGLTLVILWGRARVDGLQWARTWPDAFSQSLIFEDLPRSHFAGSDAEVARNAVLLLGDGLGFGQVLAGRVAVSSDPRQPLSFEQWPILSTLQTMSLERVITDSAAAASALATGVKVHDAGVSACPDGRPLQTLTEHLKELGFRIVVATDTALLDASPAAFSAHALSRGDHEEIAAGMAKSGVDFFIGREGRGLALVNATALDEAGFELVADADEAAAATGPLLWLVQRDHELSLMDAAEAILERLELVEERFFVFLETEEPDTASHYYDLPRLQRGVAELDRVASRMSAWAEARGDTLVVLTADHETSGLIPIGGRDGAPLRFRWTADYHTATPVPIYATGPGAIHLQAVRENTDVAILLARALGSDFVPDSPCDPKTTR
jgi:alkaline phosphatase